MVHRQPFSIQCISRLTLVLVLLVLLVGPLARVAGGAANLSLTAQAPNTTFTVDSYGDASDANPGDGACLTSGGACTLRAAIEETNALTGPDTIDFDDSIVLIMPGSELPALWDDTGGTTIKGNPTWILGSLTVTNTEGFIVNSDDNRLQGLYITNFTASGVLVRGNNNIIGTDGDGVDDDTEGNVINTNIRYGVELRDDATGNRLAGNLIGLTFDGLEDAGNVDCGVVIYNGAHNNLIGTNGDGISDDLERNVISGNDGGGVIIAGASVDQNVVAGNYIGTDITGNTAVSNTSSGVWIQGGCANTLIGTDGDGIADEAERNVISGNGSRGVRLDSDNTGTVVAGNYIGLNAAGDAAIPNSGGVLIQSGSTNNRIGTDADGTSDDLERNVISGNTSQGIYIYHQGTEGNVVAGNYVGLNAAGDAAIPNTGRGVEIRSCANNRVGGTLPAERNVISGNSYDGVFLYVDAIDNVVQGNYIGTDASGTIALGNGHWGVNISQGSIGNTIGGSGVGAGNLIAFNGRGGMRVTDSSYDNSLRSNAVFSNTELGIDLWPEGVTPNDPGDGDDGANYLQNYPVLTAAESDNSQVFIVFEGTLNSSPNTLFELDFYVSSSCDPSGYGEGEIYLGPDIVTTDGSGNASFETTLPGDIPVGYFATATAIDPDGNTSEFSECRVVTAMCSPVRWPDFSWDPNTPLVDQVTTFTGTATGTPPIDFTWDFGDGHTDVGAVVQHSYSAVGNYTVLMTATNCTGTVAVTVTHVVTVGELPCEPVHDADFAWDPLMPITDQVITFTGSASGTAPIDYAWDLGDGSTATGAVVQHSYSAAGAYTVMMTATNCTGTASVTQVHTVTVTGPPCAPVQDPAFSWLPTTPAVGQVVTFTGSASGTAPITYTWGFGDATFGTGAVVTHTYAATGIYVVVLTASNPCSAQVVTHTLTVVEEPVCTHVEIVTVTTDIAACTVGFAAELYGDPPFTHLWAFGDGMTSTLAAPTHAYTATGTYTVTLEVWNCGEVGYATHSLPVTVACVPAHLVYLPLVRR